MDPIPLPPNPFPENAYHAAYDDCLALEAAAPDIERLTGKLPPIVCARLLGHVLRLAPNEEAQGQLEREINLTNNNANLLVKLGSLYFNTLIRTFKRAKGPTPAPSTHPSRPSFEDSREYAQVVMEEVNLDHRTSRALALRRDDHRCLLTGGSARTRQVKLHAAHIIPQSTNRNINRDEDQRHHSGGVWAILSLFGYDKIGEDLAGNRIHRLENILSLNVLVHEFFDDLELWLKPIEGEPNMYRVFSAQEETKKFNSIPEYVTFSTETDLPLPDPRYLALHALCCEIAWMSGAAEYIMDIDRRRDDTKVLTDDPSGGDLLATLMAGINTEQVQVR